VVNATNGPRAFRHAIFFPGWPRSAECGILMADTRATLLRELTMLGWNHLTSGFDVATGTFVLIIFGAGVAVAALFVLARLLLRRASQSSMTGIWMICGVALVSGVLVYALFQRVAAQEQAAERRALETRAAELTAHSLAPGSALGCLDAVASALVENACERPLFASPEAVAAAVEYIDARFSLLAASAALAARDPGYQPVFERLRRGLETDRYGLVAHVLLTRGCTGADCAELRLLRDPARVVANMKARTFESTLGVHTLAWQSNGASPAVASVPPSVAPPALTTTGVSTPVASGGAGANVPSGSTTVGSSKFDFPSASSIPAVSIMSPEPNTPPAAEPRPAAPAPKRAVSPSRRQNAREAAAPPVAHPPSPAPAPSSNPPPAPATQAAPEPAPTEPATPPVRSDKHSVR
jgi:hypothetical protein